MVVQWLGLCTFFTEGLGSVSGWGTKILQAVQCGQKSKKKKKKIEERAKKPDQRDRERQDHRGPGRPWKELRF